jgi:hypothetical protein
LSLRKYFEIGERKMWYIIFKFRKYMHGTTFFNITENI